MKILIVEDDPKTIKSLSKTLSNCDNTVQIADNNQTALFKMKENKFDIILLDWMLKDGDGLHFGQLVREYSDIPIIMLSAKSDIKDIVTALNSCADDYMTKPFHEEELITRIEKLISRDSKLIFRNTEFEIKKTNIDIKNHVVRHLGQIVSLTKTEYKILTTLLLKQNTLISKEELKERILNNKNQAGHLINMHIMNLRKKLQKDLEIVTIPNRGFILKT